jgi:hypothetical protein
MRHCSTHTETVCSSLYFGTDSVLNTIRHTFFYMMKSQILLCFAHKQERKQERKQDRLDEYLGSLRQHRCSFLRTTTKQGRKVSTRSKYREQASMLARQAKQAHGRWLEISHILIILPPIHQTCPNMSEVHQI